MSSEPRLLVNVGHWLSGAVARGLGEETVEELIEHDEGDESTWYAFCQGWAARGDESLYDALQGVGVEVEGKVKVELLSITARLGWS